MPERIRPSTVNEWSETTRAILEPTTPAAASATGEGPPNILYTIGHHPALLPPFLAFTSTLALKGVLTRRDSELLALRAAWNCRSAFEWGHHVEYGLVEGLSAEDVACIAAGPDHEHWGARDRLLLRAADELHSDQQLTDATFAQLCRELSDAQVVELCFVVGNYTMLSMVANATGVPVEERVPALPER
jgi:alkylhydroperoxidase family enzyme